MNSHTSAFNELHQGSPLEVLPSLRRHFRGRRMAHWWAFVDAIAGRRVLDVGGTEIFWRRFGGARVDELELTLVNRNATPTELPNVTSIAGDATDLKEIENDGFDIVFSNSVIEHVGAKEQQARMAREIMRVGKSWYVQTPNKWFPIEPHFAFPGFQHLPEPMRIFVAVHWPLSGGPYRNPEVAARWVREIRLLSPKEMTELFPEGQMHRERFFGLCKSVTMWKVGRNRAA